MEKGDTLRSELRKIGHLFKEVNQLTANSRAMVAPIDINGETIQSLVDSGCTDSTISAQAFAQLDIELVRHQPTPPAATTAHRGRIPFQGYAQLNITIAGIYFRNVPVLVASADTEMPHPFFVGLDLLRRLSPFRVEFNLHGGGSLFTRQGTELPFGAQAGPVIKAHLGTAVEIPEKVSRVVRLLLPSHVKEGQLVRLDPLVETLGALGLFIAPMVTHVRRFVPKSGLGAIHYLPIYLTNTGPGQVNLCAGQQLATVGPLVDQGNPQICAIVTEPSTDPTMGQLSAWKQLQLRRKAKRLAKALVDEAPPSKKAKSAKPRSQPATTTATSAAPGPATNHSTPPKVKREPTAASPNPPTPRVGDQSDSDDDIVVLRTINQPTHHAPAPTVVALPPPAQEDTVQVSSTPPAPPSLLALTVARPSGFRLEGRGHAPFANRQSEHRQHRHHYKDHRQGTARNHNQARNHRPAARGDDHSHAGHLQATQNSHHHFYMQLMNNYASATHSSSTVPHQSRGRDFVVPGRYNERRRDQTGRERGGRRQRRGGGRR